MRSGKLATIIIDDDAESRKVIKTFIQQCSQLMQIVEECHNAESGLNAIQNHQPDVVFLDVQMPGFTGFELLNSLPEIKFQLIIITGYEKFAIQAIKASAMDFLLKPISILEFQKTVNKIESLLNLQMKEHHQTLLQNISTNQIQKIIVPTEENWHVISINEIVRCQADTAYTHIYTKMQEQVVSSKPLKEYEQLLPNSTFVRVHKSHLINLQYLKKFIKGRGGEVQMMDGTIIPVARQRKTNFIERLKLFTYLKPL